MMIYLVASGFASKGSFSSYTYKDDFILEALLTVLKYIRNYDTNKTNNAFAYITQICYHSFINYINKQQKHSTIKDLCFQNQQFMNDSSYAAKAVDYTIFNNFKDCDIHAFEKMLEEQKNDENVPKDINQMKKKSVQCPECGVWYRMSFLSCPFCGK